MARYKRNAKKKSNWYVYLITFAIAMGIAVLVVQSMENTLFPQTEKVSVDYTNNSYLPSTANNMTTLVMLSEMKAGTPTLYMIVSYLPNQETISCVPINPSLKATVGNTTGTLSQLYDSGGAESVMYAIENVIDMKFDNYIKFDKLSFTGFIDEIGKVSINTSYEIPNGTVGADGQPEIFLSVGAHALGGEDLYKYITYADPEFGADYQSMVLGSVSISIFNSNFRNLSSTLMQNYFNKIINTTDTSMRFEDYTLRQQAFMYTSENSYNPAMYYIPYGSFDETDGSFSIADSSVDTIRDRIGAKTE